MDVYRECVTMSFKWGVLDGNKLDNTEIREYFEEGLKVTAEYYGITVDELKERIEASRTSKQVIEKHDSSKEDM